MNCGYRPERRVRQAVHQRVEERSARPLLPLDARDVGVNAGQLQLESQHVLNGAVAGALIEQAFQGSALAFLAILI